jgi:large subunit ribosomal protein L2
MNSLVGLCRRLSLQSPIVVSVRTVYRHVEVPPPGKGQAFRRIVHYPEKYTVKPLEVTNLGGRDPVTGRVAANGIGGGIKQKFHWVDFKRHGPKDGPPLVEKVLAIIEDGCRTGRVALVGEGNNVRYDLITHGFAFKMNKIYIY